MKIVNTTYAALPAEIRLAGLKKGAGAGKMIVLKSDHSEAVNSLDQPVKISPTEMTVELKNKKVVLILAASSFSIIRVKTK